MGLKQTIKRFASVRERAKVGGKAPDDGNDADALTPINGAYKEALAEEPEDSGTGDALSDLLEPPLDDLPSASQRSRSESRKPTGKRKPSDASRLRQHGHQRRARSAEPRPQDYLYFGEGRSSSGSSRISPSPMKKPHSHNQQQGLLAVPTPSTSGRDNSGFLNTGMSNPQMGTTYSSLTYGGSLQYDYAGTQAPGVYGT